jgi:hypothetical protein
MERAIRESDFVLIICTAGYKRRSEERKGGVGYEGDIMTAEVLHESNHRKFIPVLRDGDDTTAVPSWLAGKVRIDLRGQSYDEQQYRELKSTLLNTRAGAPVLVPKGVYLDTETGLMWTMEDNDKDISCLQASEYAKHLRLGGYSDWQLPTIHELAELWNPRDGNKYGIRKPFKLTTWFVWSSTKDGPDAARYFDFHRGMPISMGMHHASNYRALYVRSSGK